MTTLKIVYRAKIAPKKYPVLDTEVDLPADRAIAEAYAKANLGATSIISVLDKKGNEI